jgi:hypothetical protein
MPSATEPLRAILGPLVLLLLTVLPLATLGAQTDDIPMAADGFPGMSGANKRPLVLDRSGGFIVGGKVLHNPVYPSQTLSCDHGYMEYFIPQGPRKTALVMWHSATTQAFQNRWDGGEGFKDMWLRRKYPVYLWDGPRVGRANWACEARAYIPAYRDQGNFVAWNFGPQYPDWWPDVQFPTWSAEAWHQATASRYEEMDTIENVEIQSDAAAVAADSGRLGKSIVYLTNSAAGLRAMMTATKSNTTNIKAIVMYESVGYVFPDNANITQGGAFGPFVVPLARFKKLAKVPAIQFIFGDHKPETDMYVKQARLEAALINLYGGHAQVLKLGDDVGLKGSTHSAFADMDNVKVAAVLDRFLRKNKLDAFVDSSDDDDDDDDDNDDYNAEQVF